MRPRWRSSRSCSCLQGRVPLRMCGFGYVTAGRRFGTECADQSCFAQSRERETDHQSSHDITNLEI